MCLTLRSLIRLKMILVRVGGENLISIVCMYISGFLSAEDAVCSSMSTFGNIVKDQAMVVVPSSTWDLLSIPLTPISAFVPILCCEKKKKRKLF